MRDFEAFTGNSVYIVAVQLVTRREADGVHEAVKLRPDFCQLGEQVFDAGVFRNVARQHNAGTQFSGEIVYAAFQFAEAIPKAMERLLATPVTRMRLPERKPIALILIVVTYFW